MTRAKPIAVYVSEQVYAILADCARIARCLVWAAQIPSCVPSGVVPNCPPSCCSGTSRARPRKQGSFRASIHNSWS